MTDHAWHPDGTLLSRQDGASGPTHTFAYDWAGRLVQTSSSLWSGSLTQSWRHDGLLAGRGWPVASGGATFAYDAAKRPVEMDKAGSAAGSFAQTYDRDGNVTFESRSLTGVSGDAGSGTQTFSYDGLNRLVASAGLAVDVTYAYDRDSNRTTVDTDTAGPVTYAYDRSGQLLSMSGNGDTELFAYDRSGNLVSSATDFDAITTYEYDAGDRLTAIDPPTASATTFSFDALGRHTRRTTGSATIDYGYVGSSEVAWQVDPNGGAATTSAVGPDGARLSVGDGTATGFALPDLHGNLAALVTAADDAYLRVTRYDGYGQALATAPASGALDSPWAYQGRLDISPDPDEPLYEFSARFYDPGLGTFTQLDTYAGAATDPLSLNRYLYAGANPATLIDPTGHAFMAGAGTGTMTGEEYQHHVARQASQRAAPVRLTAQGARVSAVVSDARAVALAKLRIAQRARSRFTSKVAGGFVHGIGELAVGVGHGLADGACGYAPWCENNAERYTRAIFEGDRAYLDAQPMAEESLRGLAFAWAKAGADLSGANGADAQSDALGHVLAFAATGAAPVPKAIRGTATAETSIPLAAARKHLQSIDALEPWNVMMLERIAAAQKGGRPLTVGEQNFLLHETREAALMAEGLSVEAAHAGALKTHPLYANYDPAVIKAFPENFNRNWFDYWGIE